MHLAFADGELTLKCEITPAEVPQLVMEWLVQDGQVAQKLAAVTSAGRAGQSAAGRAGESAAGR